MTIKIVNNYMSGGYSTLESDNLNSKVVELVNKKLGDYWVKTGRELNIQSTIIEVLIELIDNLTLPSKHIN